MEVLRWGYRIPFLSHPPLSAEPIPMPSYNPSSTKGVALGEVTQALIAKGAVELAPFPSLPRLLQPSVFGVKTSGSWRPVIDLSTLNRSVDVSHFRMETIQSVLLSVRQGDWMASIDLKEAYLQVPIHPESRPFLRFVAQDRVFQFTALCFGLSTAFSRVMAPVSAILHSWGIRMRRYLDDWLVQSSSKESLLQDLQVVLDLCRELGIVINPEKSNLEPSQVVQSLGVIINAQTFVVSPSPECISRLQSTAGEFLSSAAPPASIWLSLLGILSSLAHLVPGGWLRMRSLQLCLHQSWNRLDQSARIPWSPDCLRDLRWWLLLPRLSQGVSLHQVSPDLDFWSDALDIGWGAHLGHHITSGLWSEDEVLLSINARELLAMRRGLLHFQSSLVGKTVAVFCDNSMAVAYLCKEGGTRSPFLNLLAHGILRWSESLAIRLAPQFIPGSLNVLADTLSCLHQLPYTEWSLNQDVFRSLSRRWPVQIDFFCHLRESPLLHLFLSLPGPSSGRHGHVSPILGRSPGLRLPSVVHHSQSSCEASGISRNGANLGGSVLAPADSVSGPPPPVAGTSSGSSGASRPPAPATVSPALPGSPQASPSCLETLSFSAFSCQGDRLPLLVTVLQRPQCLFDQGLPLHALCGLQIPPTA